MGIRLTDHLFLKTDFFIKLNTDEPKYTFIKNICHSNNTISFIKNLHPANYSKQKCITKRISDQYFDQLNIVVLLEFFHTEGDYNELSSLISRLEYSEDSTHRLWAKLYNLKLQYNTYKISPQNLINQSMDIRTHNREMKIFNMTIHLLGLHELNLYESVQKITEYIKPLLKGIHNDYLRYSYELRLNSILASSLLQLNKLKEAREICTEAVNWKLEEYYPISYANLYHIMATSYLFTDFKQTVHWLNKASECLFSYTSTYSTDRSSTIQRTLYFAESYWRKNLEYIPLDPSEAAHRLIIINQKEKAITILQTLYDQNGFYTPLQEFFYGLATENHTIIQASKKKFIWQSNLFYLQLFNEENLNKYNFSFKNSSVK